MDSVRDLLSDTWKGKNQAQSVLGFLFRDMLLWRRMNQIQWEKRLTAYFEKPHNQEKPDKGNLNKALLNNDLGWAGFKKGIDFLSPAEAILTIKLEFEDREVSFDLVIDPVSDEKTYMKDVFVYSDCPVWSKAPKPKSVLTTLYRHMIASLGYNDEQWNKLFEGYTLDPVNRVGVTKSQVNSDANMLRRSLMADKLSWNVFRRGILLLGPLKETYSLRVNWTNDARLKRSVPDTVHEAIVENPYRRKQDVEAT